MLRALLNQKELSTVLKRVDSDIVMPEFQLVFEENYDEETLTMHSMTRPAE